jgi:tight adherence protein B
VPGIPLAVIALMAASLCVRGVARAGYERRLGLLAWGEGGSEARAIGPRAVLHRIRSAHPVAHRWIEWVGTALLACVVGLRLAGWPGAVLGVVAAVALHRGLDRRRARKRSESLEVQLADLVEASALAVRGGASVAQALEIGAAEVDEPMRTIVSAVVAAQHLGTPFDQALDGLATTLGTEDARLYVMVMAIHHRSGGNVAGPLHEVAETIRHRMAVRRELRALTAQGRISGVVLGVLPVAFFVVLSATSHRELAPVYRSPAGAAMILGGLILDGLAYLWIRRLLRVDV